MKKMILASSLALIGIGVLTFFLVRANRTIQQQQQALKDLAAKVGRLENQGAPAASPAPADDKLRAEANRLRTEVATLQIELNDAKKNSGISLFGRAVENSSDVNHRTFKGMPNDAFVPFTQAPAEAPRGWIPFEFNGTTYYRIPLAFAK